MTSNSLELELQDDTLKGPPKTSSKSDNKKKGHLGEDEACKHIASLGYRLVKRNFQWGKQGEIDIVAYDNDTLVFIEVKARTNFKHGMPEEAVDKKKQAQLKRIATGYYYVNGLVDVTCRFDVICIELWKAQKEIRHYKNAFI